MNMSRRRHCANHPAKDPNERPSPHQEETEQGPPVCLRGGNVDVSDQQLTKLERNVFKWPLDELGARLSRDARLARTWSLIKTRYADTELRLDLAARESGVSRDHLNEILQRSIGLTFHQTLIRYRLLKAIAIMGARDCTALDVALEVGFGSLRAFERAVRRVFGKGPKEFQVGLPGR